MAPERKAELLDAFLACFDDARAADAFGESIRELQRERRLPRAGRARPARCSRRTACSTRRRARSCSAGSARWCSGMRRFVLEHPAGHSHRERRRVSRVLLLRRGNGRPSAHRAVARTLARSSARRRTRGCSTTAKRSARRCRPSTSSRTSRGTPSARTRSTFPPSCCDASRQRPRPRSCARSGARPTAPRWRR